MGAVTSARQRAELAGDVDLLRDITNRVIRSRSAGTNPIVGEVAEAVGGSGQRANTAARQAARGVRARLNELAGGGNQAALRRFAARADFADPAFVREMRAVGRRRARR